MADLFQIEFATDDPAPVTSPYPGEVGSLTIIDTTNTLSVTGGQLVPSGQAVGTHDPSIRDATGVARARGRMLRIRFRVVQFATPTVAAPLVGFVTSPIPGNPNNNTVLGMIGGLPPTSPVWQLTQAGGTVINTLEPYATNTFYTLHVMLRDNGFMEWLDGNLINVFHVGTQSPVHALLSARAGLRTNIGADSVRVYDPGGAFSADEWSLATVNDTTVVSGESHVAGADGVFMFSFALGAASAGDKVSMQFRYQDASNYLEVYALRNVGNTAWDLYFDKVVAGVRTQLMTPVTNAGNLILIQVSAAADRYLVMTMVSGSSNMVGRATATDSSLNAATGFQAVFAASATPTRLAYFPRTGYTGIDGGINVAIFDSYFRRKRGGS